MRGGARPDTSRARLRGWFVGEEPDSRARGVWLLGAFAAMAVILFGRLVDVQLREGRHLAAMAAEQHQIAAVLHAHRGRILDRDGRLLAGDVQVYAIFADPGIISENQRSVVAAKLAPILRLGPGRIQSLIDSPNRFVYLAHGVSETVKQQLDQLDLPGVGTLPEEQRVYGASPVPNGSFAANLLGYVNHDGHGQYGVEGYYDSLLRGTDGKVSTLRDLAGNAIVLSREQRQDPQNGRDLHLGIDSQIQYWSEQALARAVVNDQAESGTLMVMDTHTGAIRAWADYPSYDSNHFGTSNVGAFKDSAVSDLYEPGSVMKVVTFAGALDRGAITPDLTINESQQTIDGFLIHDWDNHGHGTVSMQYVLEQSLNNGAIDVMRRTGEGPFYTNMLAFGLGAPTGIDLAGEVKQPLPPERSLHPADFAVQSFGQGIQVTPVEMFSAVNAIGNGGVWVQPHVVESTVNPDTGDATPVVPTTRRVISAPTAATLTHMMTGVVEGYASHGPSGFAAKIPAFKGQVAGKTGTASVPVNGRYSGDVIASFVGFLPASDPQFTMMVVIRKPHKCSPACEGAYLAAPVWKQMAQLMVDHWKIVP
ncbi:MAG: penicillin-binding protein 2 [Chloroflexi bacterium]|nr:MAG: penicillin-binding protein 2 [Chloroflexota bacterium]